jgi:hypothetical protein
MSRTTQNLRLVSETLLHTILLPGTIAVFVPYSMLSGQGAALASGILVIVGAILISLGVALLSWCTGDFIAHGRGTPNPLDLPSSWLPKVRTEECEIRCMSESGLSFSANL